MIHFAPRSSVYLFLALAEESFLQLNSSSAPCGKEDLRDAVPGERRYQTQGGKCLARFSVHFFGIPYLPGFLHVSPPPLYSLTGSREMANAGSGSCRRVNAAGERKKSRRTNGSRPRSAEFGSRVNN